jgi:hypothetical protein
VTTLPRSLFFTELEAENLKIVLSAVLEKEYKLDRRGEKQFLLHPSDREHLENVWAGLRDFLEASNG